MTIIKDERDMKHALLEIAGGRTVEIFEEMLATGLYGATLEEIVSEALRRAARDYAGPGRLMDAALAQLQSDGHTFSPRPCSTCRAVSTLIGRPFGCSLVAQQRSR